MQYHPDRHLRLVAHHSALSLVAIAFAAGGAVLVSRALAPLRTLRTRLAAVRNATARRVEGHYPAEVQPLVDDLNALLDDRDRPVSQSHGLTVS
ncbi:MAG: hypothetical protein ABI779_25420 [Acidobacteriota bacterium]